MQLSIWTIVAIASAIGMVAYAVVNGAGSCST